MPQTTMTTHQARNLNIAFISCLDEYALRQIDSSKIENALKDPEALQHNLIRFFNNDCHFMTGPLVVNLGHEPRPWKGHPVRATAFGEIINFDPKKIFAVSKLGEDPHLSADEYRKRLKEDIHLKIADGNMVDFLEDYQYDPLVAKFLKPLKKKELYQFGTTYAHYSDGSGPNCYTYLYWDGVKWCSKMNYSSGNWVLNGYALVIEK